MSEDPALHPLSRDEHALLMYALGAAAATFLQQDLKETAQQVWELAGRLANRGIYWEEIP